MANVTYQQIEQLVLIADGPFSVLRNDKRVTVIHDAFQLTFVPAEMIA